MERGDDGERVKRWRRLCKGCAGPRLLGFARRFAYRFSGAVSYGGNRRTISLNFAGGAGYDISLVATFKHACFTRAIFLCIHVCVCVCIFGLVYIVSRLLEIVIGFLRFSGEENGELIDRFLNES